VRERESERECVCVREREREREREKERERERETYAYNTGLFYKIALQKRLLSDIPRWCHITHDIPRPIGCGVGVTFTLLMSM